MMVYQRNADGASPTNHRLGSPRRGRWEALSANRTALPRGKFDLPCDKQSFNSIISSNKDGSHELAGHLSRSNFLSFSALMDGVRIQKSSISIYGVLCTDVYYYYCCLSEGYTTPYY